MNNIYILNKNYKKIGTLSNQGANPQAPYYEDLFVQELETGADTYQFSTMSTPYTQDLLEIGNHIMFTYKNRNELFTITSLEYSHNEGYKTIGVYAEGIGFDLLEVYMKRPENEKESSSDDSEGGRDEDNDGDTSTDDEYADLDDMYLDENGIIVYDKDGSGPPSEEDMYVDENGIIVYRRNKRNRKKDSLEFKNISYSRFLSILLKNTGWSYVCQPGLESIKHDITVRYDTNIFALLQDSMQSYRGVELEFVHELVGGRVQKVIKAYKDGGRGSFVGKRFEYGTNVRGITKTQEVANSEDDTILYIDNVGINVQYDVDFALKSAEVPEIEIGDTHYVIDRDFYPPMTIKARIGKIEISFSDPTVNKIYLANNKRISGSAIEEELDEDDIADIIDDYDPGTDPGTDPGSGGSSDNHIHDIVSAKRMISSAYHIPFDRHDMYSVEKITDSSDITKQDLLDFITNNVGVYAYVSSELESLFSDKEAPDGVTFSGQYFGILSEDFVDHNSNNSNQECFLTDAVACNIVRNVLSDTDNDGSLSDETTHIRHEYNLPALVCALIGAFQQHVATGGGSNPGTGDDGYYTTLGHLTVDALRAYEEIFIASKFFDANDPENTYESLTISATDGIYFGAKGIPDYGSVTSYNMRCQHFECGPGLDLINPEVVIEDGILRADEVVIYEEIVFPDGSVCNKDGWSGGPSGGGDGGGNSGNYATVTYVDDQINGVVDSMSISYLSKVEAIANYATIEYVDGKLGSGGGGTPSTGGNVFEEKTDDKGEIYYHTDKDLACEDLTCDNLNVVNITFPDGSKLTSSNNGGSGGSPSCDCGLPADYFYMIRQVSSPLIYTVGTDHNMEFNGGVVRIDGYLEVYDDDSSLSGTSVPGRIDCKELYGEKVHGQTISYYNINPLSDETIKENIRYLDNSSMPMTYGNDIDNGIVVYKENLGTRNYNDEDLLEKADLYDFIVNQVNICEYNFIDDDTKKIGFIADEYEGTKIGDRLINKEEFTKVNHNGEIIERNELLTYDMSNLLFATIGALQEEVRIKDEKIASLEARLAKIEAMLDINND